MKKSVRKQTILNNPSLRLAAFAVLCGLLVKGLELMFGIVPALILVATLGALIPLHMERKRLALKAHRRLMAMVAIQDLKEAICIYREWHPNHVTVQEMKERFSLATSRAEAIRQELKARARYLDRCEATGATPTPGAGWRQIRQIAMKLRSEVEGAAWVCEQGVSPNPGLLAPDWNSDYGINMVPVDEAEDQSGSTIERIVVPMGEYEHLRKLKRTPHRSGQLHYLSEDEGKTNRQS